MAKAIGKVVAVIMVVQLLFVGSCYSWCDDCIPPWGYCCINCLPWEPPCTNCCDPDTVCGWRIGSGTYDEYCIPRSECIGINC
ncbi:hypothetical protein E2562_032867 [Oryza meyeriana var. granulata]|uniref:Bowman-Birk serine protease inhibitors family domain-containing protein n=1 Tax=Oryza meyeriana var. granulata TaxID=110450 RepID=A0A6G1BQX5_9ORYZ|nr:hypothetical protein E2562_032867 [Oryza meyeriana var. granulata]